MINGVRKAGWRRKIERWDSSDWGLEKESDGGQGGERGLGWDCGQHQQQLRGVSFLQR